MVTSPMPGRRTSTRAKRGIDSGGLAALLVLVVGACAVLSVDVVRTGSGLKGDEATYVAMALSVAHDGDLVFERHDLERFHRFYNMGPEGIFLKRGAVATYRFQEAFPFIHRETRLDDHPERLYFGKAFIASVVAAPFVRLAGLNGFLLFNVLLFAGIVWLGYRFLSAHSPGGLAVGYTLAFFGASIVPLYMIWLTSETFHVSCVFFAYFLWFYKEVAPKGDGRVNRFLTGPGSDVAAAILLGLAIFSKPLPNGLLLIPPTVWAVYRGHLWSGVQSGVIAVAVVAASFAVNAGITGEFNYQGGLARRTFYGGSNQGFPFEPPNVPFEEKGAERSTNRIVVDESLGVTDFLRLFATNTGYFLVGRHFGFVPYFFPAVVTVFLFVWRRKTSRAWQWAILGSAVLGAVVMMVLGPYSWSGGGGPPGNRYYLSVYPALFFLTPPLASPAAAAVAGLGGALFVAQILINPFISAKQPQLSVESGMLRFLPVELTMINDLPVGLDASRSRVRDGRNPELFLYYLDHNAYLPEEPGIWVAGGRRTDIIVRTDHRPLERVEITLVSRVRNTVDVGMGGDERTVVVDVGEPTTVTLVPRGVYARRTWAYLLSVRPHDGFVPRLVDPNSRDRRYLGVAVTLDVKPVLEPSERGP